MPVDREKTLYHLTPRGWIVGSVESMWARQNLKVEPPADRVETWYQSSGRSKGQNTWRMVWSSPDVSAEDRKALHERFPHFQDDIP
jgi:hypothetical protein